MSALEESWNKVHLFESRVVKAENPRQVDGFVMVDIYRSGNFEKHNVYEHIGMPNGSCRAGRACER
ncbi:hypothetical protein PanWU01x14_062290 [Parasponia andersonii]|uniref:Uncharacterized protein n=1 Tax=Parasponia andersonii TaxID=3476 RepID=A0A2P5DHJ7_PARAD|nr:hypothetical protein PanWU01x14_062290 [Parasponia andersonii]